MELSLAGLVGAVVGTVLGVINYAVIVGFVESRLRALDKSETAAEREDFERRISIMRRLILGIDVFVLGGVGYWFGKTIGG
jgi:hypothetical protein